MQPNHSTRRVRTSVFVGVAAFALALGGCNLVRGVANAPAAIAEAATGNKPRKPKMEAAAVHAHALRLADRIALEIRVASRRFASRADTDEARQQAVQWALDAATRSCSIASQARPLTALLDLAVYTSVQRSAHERYWGPKLGAEIDEPMLVAWKNLEDNAWQMAELAIERGQIDDVRRVLSAWEEERLAGGDDTFSVMPSLVELVSKEKDEVKRTSFFGLAELLDVDPLQGLEPAAREVAQLRELGERGLYFSERLPGILSMQIELLTLRLAQQPTPASVVEDLARVSKAVENVGLAAGDLGTVVRTEREAAIRQIADELTQQRAGIVADIEAARAPLVALISESRGALDAGTQLATSLDATLKTFDGLVDRFRDPAGASARPADAEPSGRPFDVNEYATAAARITDAARELGTTIATLDRSLPQVRVVIDEAGERADRSVERAVSLALRAVLVAIGVAAAAVFLVRLASRRFVAGARAT